MIPFGMIPSGVEILEQPAALKSTRHVVTVQWPGGNRHTGTRQTIVCWSLSVMRILMAPVTSGFAFAAWHDDAENCSTWTDAAGCRCEVEP